MRKFHFITATIVFAASAADAQTFQIAQAPETGQCAVVAQQPGPIIGQTIDALVVVDNGDGNDSGDRNGDGNGDGYATRADAETALETIDACKS